MVKFLRRNDAFIWFLFNIFYLLFYVVEILNHEKYEIASYNSIFNSFFIKINNIKILSLLISAFINIIIASLILKLSIEYFIIPGKNYMPVIFYYIFTSVLRSFHYFHPLHISIILLIIIFRNIFSTSKINKFSLLFFDIGLIAGISFIIYYPSWIFLILILIALSMFRQFNWREWLTTIIGYFIPLIFILTYNYVFEKNMKIIEFYKAFINEKINYSKFINIFLIYSLLISFIAMLHDANKINTLKIFSRKIFSLFIISFILSTTALFIIFLPSSSPILMTIAFINFLFFTSFYFSTCKINKINNILLAIFLLLPVILCFFNNFKF